MRAAPILFALMVLTGCGTLPQPFYGNPGVNGARLAQPPPSRLAVLDPAQSLLPDDAAARWAHAVADALLQHEVPAEVRTSAGPDWSVVLAAEVRGNDVVPSYTVHDPAGAAQGSSEGAAIPARAWATAAPATLKAAGDQAAPVIATLLGRIEAARRQSDPNSLLNRPARIFVGAVTGAPGDGARSLPNQLRLKLGALGMVVQDTPAHADYEVHAEMQAARGANNSVRIELQWIVDDAAGERGRIVQVNEVDPRSINPYWGDTAVAVTTEAAGGIKQVIANANKPRVPVDDAKAVAPGT